MKLKCKENINFTDEREKNQMKFHFHLIQTHTDKQTTLAVNWFHMNIVNGGNSFVGFGLKCFLKKRTRSCELVSVAVYTKQLLIHKIHSICGLCSY